MGVLSFLGVDTSALDPYTSRSAIAAITDELNASLTDALAEQGYALDTANGEVALTALSASTVSTVGDDTAQYVGPVLPDADEDDASSAAPLAANVPEPATLVLFSLTPLAIRRR